MRRIMAGYDPCSMRARFILGVLLVGIVAGGLSGCIVVPGYATPAPVYVAPPPAPVYVAPAPVYVWGGWGWRRHWR